MTPVDREGRRVHRIDPALLNGTVRVSVIGCGGSGAAMVGGLARLHRALLAAGHPGGLHDTVWDGDRVSAANTVRQAFHAAEVGHPKASVVVTRLNAFYGLDWTAEPRHLAEDDHSGSGTALVISCVDRRAARQTVMRWATRVSASYHLALGNGPDFGQYVLGQTPGWRAERANAALQQPRLPTIADVHPLLLDPGLDRDMAPSCSAAEALTRQEPFVNEMVVTPALALLARLFRHGAIAYHGGYVNLETGTLRAIRVPAAEPAAEAAAA